MIALLSRAGLVVHIILLFLCITAVSASKPSASSVLVRARQNPPGLSTSYRENDLHYRRQSSNTFRGLVKRKHHAEASKPKTPHTISKGAQGSTSPPKKMSVGQKIKAAFHKFGQKVKAGFQKFGQKVKAGFKKVGHWLKETGAKIVKVALKVAAIVHKVVAKVVGWIPGIGKPLGKALELSSKGLNAASNAIHAKLGGKLGTAMNRMDKGLKVMSYIP